MRIIATTNIGKTIPDVAHECRISLSTDGKTHYVTRYRLSYREWKVDNTKEYTDMSQAVNVYMYDVSIAIALFNHCEELRRKEEERNIQLRPKGFTYSALIVSAENDNATRLEVIAEDEELAKLKFHKKYGYKIYIRDMYIVDKKGGE